MQQFLESNLLSVLFLFQVAAVHCANFDTDVSWSYHNVLKEGLQMITGTHFPSQYGP